MTVDIIASVLLGALAGMGIGGGGLLVIYLTLVKDYDQINAQAMNLLFFIFASTSSVHASKRKLDARLISIFSVSGIVGSLVGTGIAGIIPSELTRTLFGSMLIISGVITLIRINGTNKKIEQSKKLGKSKNNTKIQP